MTAMETRREDGHRWFAAFWDLQSRFESEKLRQLRRAVVIRARGSVLEIGCGTGGNFALYGESTSRIIATDPNPYMVRRALKARSVASRPIELLRARAEKLPFEDDSFDTVISTWNFCTIPDPEAALGEIRRVLRPDGEFRFLDHVRYGHKFGALWQDLLTPVWRWCGAGCHPNRDIAGLIGTAGLNIIEFESLRPVPPIPPFVIVRPVIRGVARRN